MDRKQSQRGKEKGTSHFKGTLAVAFLQQVLPAKDANPHEPDDGFPGVRHSHKALHSAFESCSSETKSSMHEPFERTLHIQVIVGQRANGPEAGAVLPWAAPTLMDRLTLSSRQAGGLLSVISSYWIASNMGLQALCQKEGLGSREVLMG